jgi:hypothetical protein
MSTSQDLSAFWGKRACPTPPFQGAGKADNKATQRGFQKFLKPAFLDAGVLLLKWQSGEI